MLETTIGDRHIISNFDNYRLNVINCSRVQWLSDVYWIDSVFYYYVPLFASDDRRFCYHFEDEKLKLKERKIVGETSYWYRYRYNYYTAIRYTSNEQKQNLIPARVRSNNFYFACPFPLNVIMTHRFLICQDEGSPFPLWKIAFKSNSEETTTKKKGESVRWPSALTPADNKTLERNIIDLSRLFRHRYSLSMVESRNVTTIENRYGHCFTRDGNVFPSF